MLQIIEKECDISQKEKDFLLQRGMFALILKQQDWII